MIAAWTAAAAISPDARTIAIGSQDGSVSFVDADTGRLLRGQGGQRSAAVASILHTYWPLTPSSPRYALILCIVFVLRLGRAYARWQCSTARTVQAAG